MSHVKSASDILDQVETIVGKMRSKDLSEESIHIRVRNFLKKNIQKLTQDRVSFIISKPVDIKKSYSAHLAQEILMDYLPSYSGLSSESQSNGNYIPLKVAGFKIGSIHSELVSGSVIREYVSKIMEIYSDLALHEAETKNELVHYDPLTGISNRLGLIKDANERCHQDELVSAIGLDLDYFKKINDELGHNAGDEALRFFARRLSEFIRYKYGNVGKNKGNHPFFGRYGGEEFLIVLPGFGSIEAMSVAREFVDWIRKEPVILMNSKNNKEVIKTIKISAGVATHDPKKPYLRMLNKYKKSQKSGGIAFPPFLGLIMQHADVALMLSKIYGRNRATHFGEEVSIPDNIAKGQKFKKELEDHLRGVDDIDEILNTILRELEKKFLQKNNS